MRKWAPPRVQAWLLGRDEDGGGDDASSVAKKCSSSRADEGRRAISRTRGDKEA